MIAIAVCFLTKFAAIGDLFLVLELPRVLNKLTWSRTRLSALRPGCHPTSSLELPEHGGAARVARSGDQMGKPLRLLNIPYLAF